MSFKFSKKEMEQIASVLGVPFERQGHCYRFVLENKKEDRRLSLEIYNDIPIGNRTGTLVSVYTAAAHLQLHFCSGFVVSEMLCEVTFVGECDGRLSGLIIEKGAACSLYANVDSALLSGDFTKLGPEVMLSGIALSLVEHILPDSSQDNE